MQHLRYDERFFLDHLAIHHEDIYRFIYSIVYDNSLAEDLTQDTMEKAWRNMGQLKETEKAKPWLFSIARREVSIYYKRNSMKKIYKLDSNILSIEDLEDVEVDVIKILEDLEEQKLIMKILEMLDIKYRRILKMHYVDEISLKDIAKILNINYNTVRTNCSRGLIKIRDLYEKQK